MIKELLEDVKQKLDESDKLEYVSKAGGVLTLASLAQFPHQQQTPLIVLIDSGIVTPRHFSSRTVWLEHNLQLHVVQRLFQREEIIKGDPFFRGVEEIAQDVRRLLDMDRFNGKYARAYFIRDAQPAPIDETANQHLQEKTLTFQYVRIESG